MVNLTMGSVYIRVKFDDILYMIKALILNRGATMNFHSSNTSILTG